MVPEHEQRWQRGLSCCVPCGVEALMGHARPARHRWSTAVSVVASAAHPRARRSELLLTASRRSRRGWADAARARAKSAAWAVVLRAMRPGGARGPCPPGLASVEYRSKRGGFSRASTSTPLQAAAHGFSKPHRGWARCRQSTSTDGSVGCRAACHAAWRRSWAMPGRPDIGGVPQQAWWLQLRLHKHASPPSWCSRLLDAHVGAGWMLPEHEPRRQRGLSCCVPCGVEALAGHARPA